MRKYPSVWRLAALVEHCKTGPQTSEAGWAWFPARPLGFGSLRNRLRCARLVFTGRADAVIWELGQ